MKNLLLLFVSFTLTADLFAQDQKLDTVYSERWINNAWRFESRVMIHYDANCKTTERLDQRWNTTSQLWNNYQLTSYTYLTTGVVGEALSQYWNAVTNTWENPVRQTLGYDQSLKLISSIGEQWRNDQWELSYKVSFFWNQYEYYDSILTENFFDGQPTTKYLTTYVYNDDQTIDSVMNLSWDSYTMTWSTPGITTFIYNPDKTINQRLSGSSRTTYTYNSSGKVINELTENIINGIWVNTALTINTYNTNNLSTGVLYQIWNVDLNSWDNSFRSTLIYTYNCLLPLNLLSFTGQMRDRTALLNWQTTNELNTSHFIIQRSIDGVSFSDVGNVIAKGSSTLQQQYTFTDNVEKISSDKVYYRLQMVDKNGNYSFSKIVPVTLLAYVGNIKTYPNPVKDQLYILFNMQNSSNAELRITDATGKTVHRQHVDAAQNNSAIGVNVANLGKGVYYVVLITNNGIQKTQFIKH